MYYSYYLSKLEAKQYDMKETRGLKNSLEPICL